MKINRENEWDRIVEQCEKFFFGDKGIMDAVFLDNELERYYLDIDEVEQIIQLIKKFEKNFGELSGNEKEYLIKKRKFLLEELKTPTNGIEEYYRQMRNLYYTME